MSIPIVSVCMITYNHEPYITEAIEGVLMQQTLFPIELIISEDCSRDGTRTIVREYAEKHSNIIVADLPEKTRGMMNNFHHCMSLAKGKYIALCEGDDYWTDSLKLQKQVDFLEANPDYSLVYTNYKIFIQKTKIFLDSIPVIREGYVYDYVLKKEINCRTMTVCLRRDNLANSPKLSDDFFLGDFYIYLVVSQQGKFKYLSDTTGVYRVLENSASHNKILRKGLEFTRKSIRTNLYFWHHYPITSSQGNEIARKKMCFTLINASLLVGNYQDMKLVKIKIRPVVSVLNTIIMILCKMRWMYNLLSVFSEVYYYFVTNRVFQRRLKTYNSVK